MGERTRTQHAAHRAAQRKVPQRALALAVAFGSETWSGDGKVAKKVTAGTCRRHAELASYRGLTVVVGADTGRLVTAYYADDGRRARRDADRALRAISE